MRPTILTVDDAKALRLLVANLLQPFDCEPTEATNGFKAFFAIESARPDLILLDVNMPIMDGVETLTRLKAAPELADIPVIMLASPADHAVIPQLSSLGAAAIVMKPFTPAALLAQIQARVTLNAR
jgi:CheY-like chemotaxis protein